MESLDSSIFSGDYAQRLSGKDALGFLLQIRGNSCFRSSVQACATERERAAFLKEEGFKFSLEEFTDILRAWPSARGLGLRALRDRRKTERYDTPTKVTEINDQQVNDAIMLDISTSGAKIESLVPFGIDSNVQFNLSLSGGEEGPKIRLSGKVVWSKQTPVSARYKVGLQFSQSFYLFSQL